MTRVLTGLLCCLLLAISIALAGQNACATGVLPKPPVVKVHSVPNSEAQQRPEKVDETLLEKMLSPKQRRHLKLSSDLQGLADSRISQPPGWVS